MTTQVRYDNDDEQGLFTNHTTMMANFEEWIKMATDNKINSSNSWNFALIDYFYDLSVLRDSENNINFQKASATLDGCVKIYSSRVDSVSNETGKLLSGLAQRKEKSNNTDPNAISGGNGDQEDKDDDSVQIDPLTGLPINTSSDMDNTRRRVHNRVLETTLVEFDQIKMKQLDQELNIDPLFKKALVDFDEGGARSLLLNTLNVDSSSRVIFDAAIKDDGLQTSTDKCKIEEPDKEGENDDIEDSSLMNATIGSISHNGTMIGEDTKDSTFIVEDEILALGMEFINFEKIATSEISPSIQQLRNVVEDISQAKSFIENVNNKFDNFLTEEELQEAIPDDGFNAMNDDNQMDADMGIDNDRIGNMDSGDEDDIERSQNPMVSIYEKDLMSYFDDNLNKNWRGREHWKVRNFKKQMIPSLNHVAEENNANGEPIVNNDNTTTKSTEEKKKKKIFEIDFFNLDDDLEEAIFTTSKKKSSIELPQRLRINTQHYLLPDDYHFSTDKITRLFIKPQQRMSLFSLSKRRTRNGNLTHQYDTFTNGTDFENSNNDNNLPEVADQEFWAESYKKREEDGNNDNIEGDVKGAELQNPFDDEDGGIDFNQAFDDAELDDDNINNHSNDLTHDSFVKKEEDGIATLPLKVAYSRVSKKVDVRRLKNNVWKSINNLVKEKQDDINETDEKLVVINLDFTAIAKEIVGMYSKQTMKDISTSFCFICLLHLANEHGLTLHNTDNFEDLVVEYNTETIKESQVSA